MDQNADAQKKRTVVAPAQQFQRQFEGYSSLYQVEAQRGAKVYRYDVVVRSIAEGRDGKMMEKELSKGTDDGQKSLNRQFCSALVKIAISKSFFFGLNGPGRSALEYVYDQQSAFYSAMQISQSQIVKIKMPAKLPTTSHANFADYELLRQYHGPAIRFEVHLHPSAPHFLLDLNDLSQYVGVGCEPLLNEDRSVRTFIELAVAQHAINTGRYTPIGAGKLFELEGQQSQRLGNGIVLRAGVMKGARVVESQSKIPQLALVLDVKSSPFFASQTVASTVEEVMNWVARVGRGQQHGDWDVVSRLLEGVRLRTNYGEKYRTFVFGRLTAGPVAQMSITDRDGRRTTIAGYFRDTYGIALRNAQLPGVVPSSAKVGDDGQLGPVYPMELLIVLSDQRVPLEKLDSRMVDMLLNANSLRPEQRARLIQQHAEQLELFSPRNTILQSIGLAINSRPTPITINVRQLPTLRFGGKQRAVQPTADKANWTREAQRLPYLQTRSVANWLILHPERDSELVEEFVDRLTRTMQQKGMRFSEPELASYPRNFGDLVFRDALNAYPNLEFIMLVSPKYDDTHNMLKYLEATTRRIVTQQVALETVKKLVEKNQKLALENIANKINLKNYGLNYATIVEPAASTFDLSTGELLVIGYDVSHPSPASAQERFKMREQGVKEADSLDPSVVGITANSTGNPQAFVGEYFYQASRKESVDMQQLSAQITRILRELKENRPQASRPSYVVVLRDGISEGQYLMAMREELEAIHHGIHLFDHTYSPKLLFVVCTKRHNKKFFAIDQHGRVDNLPPGSVIQGVGVTRPDCPEFFMQSHYPLKGTGRSVEYTVLHDGIGISQDQLQGLLNACCFSHQIVVSAISLPEPVYQADELAKRGMNNLKTYRRMNRGIPRLPNGLPDHDQLNRVLSIAGSSLSGTRFTA